MLSFRLKKQASKNVADTTYKHYNFLNYERFSNIDAIYTDFHNKLMKVIYEIDPNKEIRIKNNNQDWFDREVTDLIHVREKLFLKFKKSKLHIDEEIYKKVRNQVQNLIKNFIN